MDEFLNSRRTFLKHSGAVGVGLGLNSIGLSSKKTKQEELLILHTNDVHSHIHPFKEDHPRYAGRGGIIRRANMIDQYRKNFKHVLLLDAGDIFQGTPFFNFYGGELEMKLMSKMGYDAATLGNHDFDGGIEGLIKAMKFGDFSLVNCNYTFENELNKIVKPFKIFKKGNIRVGVFGVGIELDGLVESKLCKGTIYMDPISSANKTAEDLRQKHHCDYIVCLSHLGYKYDSEKISDIILAQKTRNIDLIIGGHTHTFLPQPVIETNTEGDSVLVSQAAWAGLMVGVIKVVFKEGEKISAGTSALL